RRGGRRDGDGVGMVKSGDGFGEGAAGARFAFGAGEPEQHGGGDVGGGGEPRVVGDLAGEAGVGFGGPVEFEEPFDLAVSAGPAAVGVGSDQVPEGAEAAGF